MMSMRSDFFGSLQSDEPLFDARQQIDVPPLGEASCARLSSRPAELLGARFETDRLVDIIARRAAEDSVKDVGALPLLSYTLDDMWSEMVKAGATACCGFPRNPSSLAACWSSAPTGFSRTHPGAEGCAQAHSHAQAARPCARTASRRVAAPLARSSRTRSGGSSPSLPAIPTGFSSP